MYNTQHINSGDVVTKGKIPHNRRNVLVKAGTVIGGLSLVGTASSTSSNDKQLNTDFNPAKRHQVVRFVVQFDKLDGEDLQADIWSELDKEQTTAAAEERK